MTSVLALRHVPFEDLGSFAVVLRGRGFEIHYRDAGVNDLSALDPLVPDLLVVLGGPIGAYETESYPFLADEIGLIERRLAAGLPTLGLCLGSQLMVRALGAAVYPGSGKEIGWAPIALSDAGTASPLRHIGPEQTAVLHWHGDTFDLPHGALHLASTAAYANQAFSWGSAALALQFHPEARAADLERWYIGHAVEIAATPGVTVPQLRADAARWGDSLARQGARMLEDWLDQVGLSATESAA